MESTVRRSISRTPAAIVLLPRLRPSVAVGPDGDVYVTGTTDWSEASVPVTVGPDMAGRWRCSFR